MGIICGEVNFNNIEIKSNELENMIEDINGYNLDEIKYEKYRNILMVEGIQYITKENKINESLIYNNGSPYMIVSDAILDNRTELLNLLDISNKNYEDISENLIILEAYKKWGKDAPKYFLGDFTFAIWDFNKEELICARDHVGKRTLYYSYNKGNFYFSTTIKPIKSLLGREIALNERWLCDFLALKGVAHESNEIETQYKNIYQLPAATVMIVNRREVKKEIYWDPLSLPKLKYNSDEEYIDEFNKIFQEAVQCRLSTTSNVGILLSGGLDSGSVACIAAKKLEDENKKLYAFSSIPLEGYENKKGDYRVGDESEYINEILKMYKNIDISYMRCQDRNSYKDIDELIDIFEQPYKMIENSYWLKNIFEKCKESNCRVLLNGQYGNSTISYGDFFTHIVTLFRKGHLIKVKNEIDKLCNIYNVPKKRIRKIALRAICPYKIRKSYCKLRKRNIDLFLNQPISKEMIKKWNISERFEAKGLMNYPVVYRDLEEIRKFIVSPITLAHIGTIETKLSLAYGVVERDPTRDKRVIEFCLRIPSDQFVRDGEERILIRRAMKGVLPDKIRLNRSTRGIQAVDWKKRLNCDCELICNELQEYLNNKIIQGLIDVKKVKMNLESIGEQLENVDDVILRMIIITLIFSRFIINKSKDISII